MIFLDPRDIPQLITVIVLLLISAFFSSAETALTTVNRMKIRALADEGNRRAKTVEKLIEDPSKLLSTILIGNNIVNLTASSLTTTLMANICTHAGMPEKQSLVIGIGTGVLTILVLIFGEITPKTLASIYSTNISMAYAGIINLLTKLLTPVIFIVNKLARGFMHIFRINPDAKHEAITESELLTIVDASHEEGVIESEERKMITNVVDFGDSVAKDVMIPRIDMTFAKEENTYEELLEIFDQEKFSRLPVYNETIDDVVGIVNLKDVFFYQGPREDFQISKIMRKPYFTYEFKKTSELLIEMRKESIAMAIVLDEYGATAGLITLEDLLEEIVGEIRDEYDEYEEDVIQMISEHEYLVNGTAKLDEVNEAIGLELESDDYDSIAGHIINLLEHLPEEGEKIADHGVEYTVDAVEKNRIEKVHIRLLPSNDEADQLLSPDDGEVSTQ
jgi:CBS domain containing-hemolysin-like protein